VHSVQGVSADSYYAILGEGVSRARPSLYQQFSSEADHEHAKPVAARLSTIAAAAARSRPT
jgi:hypothetical protein